MSDAIDLIFRPDAKGRITLGKLADGISSYRGHREKDGSIVLRPYVEIPASEHWIFKNPEALASLKGGVADVAAGRVVSRGSFAKHLED